MLSRKPDTHVMTPVITRDNIVETNMVTPSYCDAQNVNRNQQGDVYGNGNVHNAGHQQDLYYNNVLTNNLNPWRTRGNTGETNYVYNNDTRQQPSFNHQNSFGRIPYATSQTSNEQMQNNPANFNITQLPRNMTVPNECYPSMTTYNDNCQLYNTQRTNNLYPVSGLSEKHYAKIAKH